MSEYSVTAVREHMSGLWEAVLRSRLPNTWVPVPVKRGLLEAVVASIYAYLSRSGHRVPITRVYEAARSLGLRDDEEEMRPRRGEAADVWWLRVTQRREDETASEWVERVSILALAILPFIVYMKAVPFESEAQALPPAGGEEEEEVWL